MRVMKTIEYFDRQLAELNAAIATLRKGSNKRRGFEIRKAAIEKEREKAAREQS